MECKLILITSLVLIFGVAISDAALPAAMLGYWQGVPQYSPLGPWPGLFNFSILALPYVGNGSSETWLMSDNFNSDFPLVPCSQQQFWVVEGQGVTYCGSLRNFFSSTLPGPIRVFFAECGVTPTSIKWCIENVSVTWTLTLSADLQSLQSQVILPAPVKHLQVNMTRASVTPAHLDVAAKVQSMSLDFDPLKPPCNLSFPIFENPSFEPTPPNQLVRCPISGLTAPASQNPHKPQEMNHLLHQEHAPAAAAARANAAKYQHCYVLNPEVNIQLAWNFNKAADTVDIQIAAPLSKVSNTSYLAIGFQPEFPGMIGADIALGYMTGPTDFCLRTMYAAEYVGTPVDSDSMTIFHPLVGVDQGQRFVSFTRPLQTGNHNITDGIGLDPFTIMWASGAAPSNCVNNPSYHANIRGVRCINWEFPSTVFPDFMKC